MDRANYSLGDFDDEYDVDVFQPDDALQRADSYEAQNSFSHLQHIDRLQSELQAAEKLAEKRRREELELQAHSSHIHASELLRTESSGSVQAQLEAELDEAMNGMHLNLESPDAVLDSTPANFSATPSGYPVATSSSSSFYDAHTLTANKSLMALKSVHATVAIVLIGMIFMNFVAYFVAKSSGYDALCQTLGGYMFIIACYSCILLLAQAILYWRFRSDIDAWQSWSSGRMAKACFVLLLVSFAYLIFHTCLIFFFLSHGYCSRAVLARQICMIDGVLVLCTALFALMLLGLRWKAPHISYEYLQEYTGDSDRPLPSGLSSPPQRRTVLLIKSTLLLTFVVLTIGNLVAVGVNGRLNLRYHFTPKYTPCPHPIDCSQSAPSSNATMACVNQEGTATRDISLCFDEGQTAPPPAPPSYRCPRICPSSGENIYRWNWQLPACPEACNEEYDGPQDLAMETSCWNLNTTAMVPSSLCRNESPPLFTVESIHCPPNPCADCKALFQYSKAYAVTSLFIALFLLADLISIMLNRTAASSSNAERSRSSSMSQEDSENEVVRPPPMPVALKPSLLSLLVAKAPRFCFVVAFVMLISYFIYTLYATAEFQNAQCANYLAISIVNAMVTINATLVALGVLIRRRQQIWTAINPLESIGLL